MEKRLFQKVWSKGQWEGLPVHRSLLTPMMFLERALHVFPEKTAVVDGNRRYTYAEFGSRVYRLASALIKAGIDKGDRVAVLLPNTAEFLEIYFAVPQAGGVLVPINRLLSSGEVKYILRHSGAKALIVHGTLGHLLEPIRGELDLPLVIWTGPEKKAGDPADFSYEDFLREGRDEPFVYRVDDEDQIISINYTSGTTGQPKGVMYTHRGAYLNAMGEIVETGLNPSSVYLWTLPMYHCNGWCFPWAVTGVGALHVCLPKVRSEEIFRLIGEEKVTHLCAAPTVIIKMISEAPRDYRFPRPLRIVTAAAPPPPAVIEQAERMGAEVIHVYGLTETYGPHTVCVWKEEWDGEAPAKRALLKGRQGVGYIHAPELRVVDENMEDVPADGKTLGEVVMRGNNVMKGYYRDEKATAEAFRGGWFHSGDLAVVHPDGYIELKDRKKDIIISGGVNISTIEVERVLYRHPDILEAAVVGVPDPYWGEVPKAFVTLRPGARLREEEVIAFAREHLAHFKCPKEVSFGPLPKTSTGKVQKFKLRERALAEKEARLADREG
ncbi:MAG: acyl-CoA synthetase [Thermoactinomycetaceae bacterium]|nr:acyl-CoA synthetase [Bacillota bacterium]MBO2531946.1 acyl-CoA synthetase [Thermoactinomycetaceae bacterium]